MSTVSPELVLVDPDLRATAIAALPSVRAFAFLEHPPSFLDQPTLLAPSRSRVRAAAVYFVVALARTLVVNAAVLVGVAAVVLILNLFA
jgi:hypothetical protein